MIFVFILLFAPAPAGAEIVRTYYSCADWAIDICCDGGNVWLATNGGVVKRNRLDGSYIRYTVADGLVHDFVQDVFVCRSGVAWFATDGGLSRFDGKTWTNFQDAVGFPLTDIRCMTEDLNRNMWFGSRKNGVFRFDGVTWRQYTAADGLDATDVRDIEVDTGNVMWFAVSFGVVSFDGVTWKKYSVVNGDSLKVRDIAVDRNGVKWFSTPDGLTSFDGVKFTKYPLGFSDTILSIAIDENGVKWVNTYLSRQVGGYDESGWHWLPQMSIANEPVFFRNHLAVDADGGIWASVGVLNSEEFGVACFDGTNWNRYTADKGLASNMVNSIGVDRENRKYFGTFYNGISCYDGKTWSLPLSLEETGHEIDFDSFDRDDVMWINTSRFLMSIKGTERTVHTYPDGTRRGGYAIAVGEDNTKWLATGVGISSFDGRKWKDWPYPYEDRIGLTYPFCLAVDKNNVVWVGINNREGGAFSFDGNVWKRYYPPDGTPNLPVLSIAVDRHNVKWFSMGNGIFCFDGVTWTRITGKNGERITANKILIDLQDVKWFLRDQEVIRYDGLTWETHVLVPPGTAGRIYCSVVDQDNVKWFSLMNNGVVSIDDRTQVSVHEDESHGFTILNRPNPFNPSTTISFTLPEPGKAELTVYDITGRKVRELLSERRSAGAHSVIWDGRDGSGRAASSGVYFARLHYGNHVAAKRMVLVR